MGGVLSTPGPPGPPGPPGQRGPTGLEGIPGNVSWEALSDAQKQNAFDKMQTTISDYISINSTFAENVGEELTKNQIMVDTIVASVDAAGANSKLIKTLADTLSKEDPYKSRLKGRDGSIASETALENTLKPKSMWCADGNTCKIPDDKYVTKLRVKAGDAVDFAADAPSQDITQTPNTDSRGTSSVGLDGTIVGKYDKANTLNAAKASVLEIHGIGRPYPDTGGQKRMPKQVNIYDDVTVGGKLKVNGNSITSADANWLTLSNGAGTANLQVKGNDIKVNGGFNIGVDGKNMATIVADNGTSDYSNLTLKAGSASIVMYGWNDGGPQPMNNTIKINGALYVRDRNILAEIDDIKNNYVRFSTLDGAHNEGQFIKIRTAVGNKCLDGGSNGQDCDDDNAWRRFRFFKAKYQNY